jgi:hypothetical protein
MNSRNEIPPERYSKGRHKSIQEGISTDSNRIAAYSHCGAQHIALTDTVEHTLVLHIRHFDIHASMSSGLEGDE